MNVKNCKIVKNILFFLNVILFLGCANLSPTSLHPVYFSYIYPRLTQSAPWKTIVIPPEGALITAIKAPLTTDFDNTPVGRKLGEVSTHYFHDIFFTGMDAAWGQAGLQDILSMDYTNKGKIGYADYEYVNIFYIYKKFTIKLYGK